MRPLPLVETPTKAGKQGNSHWKARHIKWGHQCIALTMREENSGIKQSEYLVLCKTYDEMFRERTKDMEKKGVKMDWGGVKVGKQKRIKEAGCT